MGQCTSPSVIPGKPMILVTETAFSSLPANINAKDYDELKFVMKKTIILLLIGLVFLLLQPELLARVRTYGERFCSSNY